MKKPTVKQIVQIFLKENGFDGLCGEDCGCKIDDLFPCDGDGMNCPHECVPGYLQKNGDIRPKKCKNIAEANKELWERTKE